MRKLRLPIRRHRPALHQTLDIGGQAEGHDIGRLVAGDHGLCLPRGSAVRLPDLDGAPGIVLVGRLETRVELRVQFPGRIVGHVQENGFAGSRYVVADDQRAREQDGDDGGAIDEPRRVMARMRGSE